MPRSAKKAIPSANAAVTTDRRLPSGWRMVRFGDVVRDVNEAERNPLDAGLDRYVGLEHIEPDNLHLTRWGNLADNEVSFTKRFRKGQVMFGKRRAYQRKVAVTEFDGICSSDILTFEAKCIDLLPELLPFIVQSDGFFEHALGTSSGSLSPRTRWSQLKDYEFPLPPKDEQRHIADILVASRDTRSQIEKVMDDLIVVKLSLQMELLRKGTGSKTMHGSPLGEIPSDWTVNILGSLTHRICVGLAMSVTKHYRESGTPMLRNQNIRPLKIDDDDLVYLDPEFADSMPGKKLNADDVITARTGANMGQTCIVPKKYEGAHTFTTLITTCNNDRLLPEYLVQHMNSIYGFREMERLSTSGGKNNLNVTDFVEYRIATPPIYEQLKIIKALSSVDEAIERLRLQEEAAKNLYQNLLNIYFGKSVCLRGSPHVQ
jgi:type I restriction enzyme S subunit